MQLYLGAQAVDQSSFVGEGASFEVSSKKMPNSDGFSYETQGPGLTLSTRQGQHDEKVLVYKTARIEFSDLGEPLAKDRRAMNSVLMELYALMHPPLYKHANIVTLLALAWGTNPFEPSYRLPVIVTEHADHGNLADLQAREVLSSEVKQSISLDIGRGLKILHQCGIVHGDVKSENILIFSDTGKKYVAKLGDFGFSLVGEASADQVYIGGTTPWRAPESASPVPRHELAKTDIYSYGLTIWRIAMDGMNPFAVLHGIASSATYKTQAEATERLKNQDELKNKMQLDQWYPQWVLISMEKLSGGALPAMKDVAQHLQQAQTTLKRGDMNTAQALDFVKFMYWLLHRLGMSSDPMYKEISTKLNTAASADLFYGKVAATLRKCISKSPQDRDLPGAIATMSNSSDNDKEGSDDANSEMLLRQSFDHHVMSWQAVRELQPAVQTFVLERFRARGDWRASQNLINQPECFVLASFYMNGYGTQTNLQEARRLILLAAANGHQVARANAWRMCKVTGTELPQTEANQEMLETQAYNGSRGVLQDLAPLIPERTKEIKRILKAGLAGIGSSFWGDDLLHGTNHGQWANTFRDTPILVKNFRNLRDIAGYKVNKRGDRVLHMAASCGYPEAIHALLDNFDALTVNQLNDTGETPLLSACRAGQREVVEVLMQRGADPTITTSWRESPLHWLISFENEEVEAVGQALISKGAEISLLTMRQINYSVYPSGVDVDILPPGAPLAWAVHHDRPDIVRFLLKAAGSARICIDKPLQQPTPLEWAAHYHHRDCLEIMITAMKEQRLNFTYQDFLKYAVHSADMFSMVLRNGASYLEKFKNTMDYLLEETHGAAFATGLGEFGYTLLYYAISEGHDIVVEYLLAPETELLLQAGWQQLKDASKDGIEDVPVRRYGVFSPDHVNIPCRDEQRTPLLECVRWNRHKLFDLLVRNRADIQARSRNPFDGSKANWSALHTFAHASHNTDFSLAERIIESGVAVDGQPEGVSDLETPLLVALKNNSLSLAEALLRLGADINAACISSGLITLEHPTSILGQIIASAARGSVTRLRFLLKQQGEDAKAKATFLVEPARQLTALHLAARAHKGVFDRIPDGKSPPEAVQRPHYDFVQNRDIMNALLQHFGHSSEFVNATAGEGLLESTALHLAVDAINLGAVELLLDYEMIDISITNNNGYTALDLAVQAARHQNIQCDGPCHQVPLPGRRWHCTNCPDHDLCDPCYEEFSRDQSSHEKHEFKEMSLNTTIAEAQKQWRANVPSEIEDLSRIIGMLQAMDQRRQAMQATEESMASMHI